MKTLKELLDDLKIAIVSRKQAEAALEPLKATYDVAVQVEAQALIALEQFRTSGQLDLGGPPKVSIKT